MRDFVLLYVNGKRLSVAGSDALLPLSDFLRARQRCTGVKVACGEGACGACTVLVGVPSEDETPGLAYHTAYACLHPVFQMDGRHVVTVEGLTPAPDTESGGLSPVQAAMVAGHGSQCGFCTPGFVVSLTSLFDCAPAPPDDAAIRESVSGNLCRCTGYLPILRSAQGVNGEKARGAIDARFSPRPIAGDLRRHADDLRLANTPNGDETEVFQPATWDEAVRLRAARPDCRVTAGGTGFASAANLTETAKSDAAPRVILSLAALIDAIPITAESGDALHLPATATWATVARVAQSAFPEFAHQLARFGSPQLRATATVGGSIAGREGNADIFPLLLAQNARIILDSVGGGWREQPIADFLAAGCPPGALVAGVTLPLPAAHETLRLYKVRRRQTYDRSVFCAAVVVEVAEGQVVSARMAVGGVGPVPHRLPETESFLAGKSFDEATMREAGEIAASEVAPVRDAYAEVGYRRKLAANLGMRFWAEVSFPLPPAPSPRFAGGEGESYQSRLLSPEEDALNYKTPPLPQRSGERGPGGEGNPKSGQGDEGSEGKPL